MSVLKKILLVILIIIAIPLIIALFVKKEYAVERQIVINKPTQEVFNYIKLIKNQDNYSVWAQKDPGMKKEYKGTDGTVGFVSSWESANKEVGTGEQEIKSIDEGNRMEMKLRFKVPFEAEDDAYFVTERLAENQTRVKWGFAGAFPYPFNIMQLFMNMDEAVGKDLQGGLDNLKTVLEK
ncbi:MAG: SRPBCC family protein [Bacteroidota bacterium]